MSRELAPGFRIISAPLWTHAGLTLAEKWILVELGELPDAREGATLFVRFRTLAARTGLGVETLRKAMGRLLTREPALVRRQRRNNLTQAERAETLPDGLRDGLCNLYTLTSEGLDLLGRPAVKSTASAVKVTSGRGKKGRGVAVKSTALKYIPLNEIPSNEIHTDFFIREGEGEADRETADRAEDQADLGSDDSNRELRGRQIERPLTADRGRPQDEIDTAAPSPAAPPPSDITTLWEVWRDAHSDPGLPLWNARERAKVAGLLAEHHGDVSRVADLLRYVVEHWSSLARRFKAQGAANLGFVCAFGGQLGPEARTVARHRTTLSEYAAYGSRYAQRPRELSDRYASAARDLRAHGLDLGPDGS